MQLQIGKDIVQHHCLNCNKKVRRKGATLCNPRPLGVYRRLARVVPNSETTRRVNR